MTQYTLAHGALQIVVKTHGAELTSLKKGDQEYLYQKQEGYWQRQSPVLFPIVGGLRDGKYTYKGQQYQLPQHGLARDRDFTLTAQSADRLVFDLQSDDKTRALYPFDFILRIAYVISGDTLRIEYEVRNIGSGEMVCSIGGHPAFALEGDISEYSLIFPDDTKLSRDILVGGLLGESESIGLMDHRLVLDDDLFARDALILGSLQSREIILEWDSERVLTFDRGNLPHFGIWKQVCAPFLCLEPWQGYADRVDTTGDLTEKEGTIKIPSGGVYTGYWSVSL